MDKNLNGGKQVFRTIHSVLLYRFSWAKIVHTSLQYVLCIYGQGGHLKSLKFFLIVFFKFPLMITEFQTLSFIFSVWILFLQAPCVFVHFTFSFRQLSFKPVVSWLSTCAKIKAEVVAPSSTSARLQVCPVFQFFIRYSHID